MNIGRSFIHVDVRANCFVCLVTSAVEARLPTTYPPGPPNGRSAANRQVTQGPRLRVSAGLGLRVRIALAPSTAQPRPTFPRVASSSYHIPLVFISHGQTPAQTRTDPPPNEARGVFPNGEWEAVVGGGRVHIGGGERVAWATTSALRSALEEWPT